MQNHLFVIDETLIIKVVLQVVFVMVHLLILLPKQLLHLQVIIPRTI